MAVRCAIVPPAPVPYREPLFNALHQRPELDVCVIYQSAGQPSWDVGPGWFPTDHTYPAYEFPFTYASETDPLTGRTAGLLDRCTATGTCPRIFHVATVLEVWEGRQSLGLIRKTSGISPVARLVVNWS